MLIIDNSILLPLTTLTISGLAFITYKHHFLSRRILRYAGIGFLGLLLFSHSLLLGFNVHHMCLQKALESSQPLNKNADNIKYVNMDSLVELYASKPDTVIQIMKQRKTDLVSKYELEELHANSVLGYYNEVEKIADEQSKALSAFRLNVFLIVAACLVLYYLSFLFEGIREPNSDSKNNPTEQTV